MCAAITGAVHEESLTVSRASVVSLQEDGRFKLATLLNARQEAKLCADAKVKKTMGEHICEQLI